MIALLAACALAIGVLCAVDVMRTEPDPVARHLGLGGYVLVIAVAAAVLAFQLVEALS